MPIKPSARNTKLFTSRRQSLLGAERAGELAAIEEPFEIRILHWFKDVPKVESLAVLMRTPGFDRELTAGYLLGESIIAHRDQLLNLHPLGDVAASNEYLAELSRDVDLESHMSDIRFVNSACLSCGKRGVEAMPEPATPPLPHEPQFNVRTILSVPSLLRARALLNACPAGLSTAALVSPSGNLEAAFDDVHSSNALSKVLGHCFLGGQALADRALFLSAGCHFELVLKAIAAGCPILIVLGMPSSLAIEAARARQLTLVGLLSDEDFHVYSGESRIP